MVDIFKSINEMISLNKDKENNEIWVSSDIKVKLNGLKQYKEYKIHSSILMPNDYMIIGKLYYTKEEINNT